MAQISIMRSAFCLLRRHINVSHSSLQNMKQFLYAGKLSFDVDIARYNSDSENSRPVWPKTSLRSRQDDVNILEDIDENLSNIQQNEYMLPSEVKKAKEDLLLKKITRCYSSAKVLEIYKEHMDIMDDRHMLRTLKVLNILVAKGVADCKELHDDRYFQDLCHRIHKFSRQLDVQDLVSLLQFLCRLEVPANSKLVQSTLQLLRHSINDMDVNLMVQLEFILRKLPPTPLSEAIHMAVPMILENALNQEPLENFSLTQLSRIVAFSANSLVRNIGIVLQEIYRRGSVHPENLALKFLWSLLDMYTKNSRDLSLTEDESLAREVLLKECLEVVTRNLSAFQISQIETTFVKMGRAYEKGDFHCYNEYFLHTMSLHWIEKDVGLVKVSHTIRRLLQMNYMSEELVEYVIPCILQDPENVVETPLPVRSLITAITSCPGNHHEVIKVLLQNKSFSINCENCLRMPTLNVVLDLLSAHYYHQPLLEIITDPDFLALYMEKYPRSNVSIKQLLQLHQIFTVYGKSSLQVPDEYLQYGRILMKDLEPSDSDLRVRLNQILEEPDVVFSGVLTDTELYIDHLIVINEDGSPVKVTGNISSEGNRSIGDLNIPAESKRIAILDIKRQDTHEPRNVMKRYRRVDQQLLEASGFLVVPVLQSVVNQLTADEKNLYIKSLLKNACVDV